MARTRTAGIRIDRDGRLIIDKEHRGIGIYLRLGPISQEDTEQQLAHEMARIDAELRHDANHPHRFVDCAERYLAESQKRRSVGVAAWHIRLLTPYIGMLEIHQIHDATLKLFVHDRLASGVKASTVNRSLEVVRTILNRAARSYRDNEGRPSLDAVLPLITKLPESPRAPYPITWDEQDRLFSKLSSRLASMVLFAVNTGLRDSDVCGLEWSWEVPVPEVGRSVFVIPAEAFKTNRPHVAILNDIAWSIVEAQRGQHPIWVFPYQGERVRTMNNTAWQRARSKEALAGVRIHDLRHNSESGIIPRANLPIWHRYSAVAEGHILISRHYSAAVSDRDCSRIFKETNDDDHSASSCN